MIARALTIVASIASAVMLSATAQGQARREALQAGTSTAQVEGDLYLVMKSGDTKPGAGRTVYLLEDSPDFRQKHARLCANYTMRYKAAEAADEAEWKRRTNLVLAGQHVPAPTPDAAMREFAVTIDSISALIAASVRAQAASGMQAHYHFEGVPAGSYILFAEWKIGANHYQWWAPIQLAPGQHLRRDLDNDAEAQGKVYCNIR